VLVVVNSNSGYVSIRTTHDKYFDGRKIGTDSSNGVLIPQFEDVARMFGLEYSRVSTVQQMDDVLSSYLKREDRSPFILEIMTLTNQTVEPVIISVFNKESGKMESGSLVDLYPSMGEGSE
jgi:acetolactate synthase-1/2/3 large subunit